MIWDVVSKPKENGGIDIGNLVKEIGPYYRNGSGGFCWKKHFMACYYKE